MKLFLSIFTMFLSIAASGQVDFTPDAPTQKTQEERVRAAQKAVRKAKADHAQAFREALRVLKHSSAIAKWQKVIALQESDLLRNETLEDTIYVSGAMFRLPRRPHFYLGEVYLHNKKPCEAFASFELSGSLEFAGFTEEEKQKRDYKKYSEKKIRAATECNALKSTPAAPGVN